MSYQMNPIGDFYVHRCNANNLLKKSFSHKRCVKTETLFRAEKMGFTFDFYFQSKFLHKCAKIGALRE
jgi:hypothetical protein